MPSASPAATDAELTAFAASFEEFVRAAKRARARVEPDATLTTSQYDLLCPLIEGDDARLWRGRRCAVGTARPRARRRRQRAARHADGRRARRARDRHPRAGARRP